MDQTSWGRENKDSPLMAICTTEILAIKEIKIKGEKIQKINFEKSWANGIMNSHVPVTFFQEL